MASIIARGRGVGLDLDPLPASQPVTVQMKNGTGVCWEALYSAPARHNQAGLFSDRGD